MRPVPVEGFRNPVRSTRAPPIGPGGYRSRGLNGPAFPVVQPLALGPGGRVITIGLGRGDVPEISLVDVDTGDIDLLARLDGVEPSEFEPVSAVAVGEDLVFTAAGCLWRREGAFAEPR